MPDVSSPGFLTATPSAIVNPGPSGSRARSLHADDPHLGAQRAQRKRDAGREAAAADRDHDSRYIRDLVGKLEPDRPLSGDHERVLDRDARTSRQSARRTPRRRPVRLRWSSR